MNAERQPSRRKLDPGELQDRLDQLGRTRLGGTFTDVRPLEGGRSSLTYRATWRRSNQADRDVVVKIAPPGLEPIANRDVLRQARILDLLHHHGGVPVPDTLLTDDGEPPEVPPLFIMGLISGDSVEPVFSASGPLPSPPLVRARALAAVQTLAALHRVPVTGIPASEPVVSVADELDRWDRTLAAAGASEQSAEVNRRLHDLMPPDIAPTLVHGDYRQGNCLFVDSTLTAVLDWEIWALGDPRVDLAWLLLTAMPDVHPHADRLPEGMPSADELIQHYSTAVQRDDATSQLEWFLATALYKMAAMFRHIGKKFPADDPRRTEREAAAARTLTVALGLLGGDV